MISVLYIGHLITKEQKREQRKSNERTKNRKQVQPLKDLKFEIWTIFFPHEQERFTVGDFGYLKHAPAFKKCF